MRIGLVLGAGGSLGWVFHLGVLEGLRRGLEQEPAESARIIGTSAGAAIAAGLVSGATTDEIVTAMVTPPTDAEMAIMQSARQESRRFARWLRPSSPRLLALTGSGLGLGALVGLLPAGIFPTITLRRFPNHGSAPWPPALWIPAVNLETGRLLVIGRDRTDIPIIDAIEATAAVPALFLPKEIDGDRYIDGAVRSPTNADLLCPEAAELDLIVVSSPMTRPGRGPVRVRARRQLRDEAAQLRRSGTRVVTIEPDEDVLALAEGFPRNRPDAAPAVIERVATMTADYCRQRD